MFRFERVCSRPGFRVALIALTLWIGIHDARAARCTPGTAADLFYTKLKKDQVLALPEDERLPRYVESLNPYENALVDNRVFGNDFLRNSASRRELSFTIDSTLLGQVQSKVTKNHEGATAAMVLMQRYFAANCRRYRVLDGIVGRSNLIPGKNAGFRNAKIMTVILREDTPEIRAAVEEAFTTALNQFSADLKSLKLVDEAVVDAQKGPLARPEQWFLGSFGKGPHDSDMNAGDMKRARWTMSIGSDRKSNLAHDVTPYRVQNAQEAERLRVQYVGLQKNFADRFVENVGGVAVPSLRVLKALRKVPATDLDSYIEAVRTELAEPNLTREQVIAMRDYNRTVADYLTADPYAGEWRPLTIEASEAGTFFYDMDGLGAEDIQQAMAALAKVDRTDRDAITDALYEATMPVSNKIRDGTNRIRGLVENGSEPLGEHQAVGDEGKILPLQQMDGPGRTLFYRRVSMRFDGAHRAGRFKWVYVHGNRMKGWTRASLTRQETGRYVDLGVNALRAIKRGLLARGYSEEFVQDLFIPLEILPRDVGVDVNLCLPRMFKGVGAKRENTILRQDILDLYRQWHKDSKIPEAHDLHFEYF